MIVNLSIGPFRNWLQDQGAEFLELTNQWEVLRFRACHITVVVYKNKQGQLNYPDSESAQKILAGYHNNQSMDLRPYDSGGAGLVLLPAEPSLRDVFAGRALQGMLASRNGTGNDDTDAQRAYAKADAMLRAREAK